MSTATAKGNIGRITQIIGSTFDVEFEESHLPAIYNAVKVVSEHKGVKINLTGETVDGRGPIDAEEYWPIHREPPSLRDLSTKTEVFETGIKVIDLLTPFV